MRGMMGSVLLMCCAALGVRGGMVERYDRLLVPSEEDAGRDVVLGDLLNGALAEEFERAVESARKFEYVRAGEPAYYDFKIHAEDEVASELRERARENDRLQGLFSQTIPMLAYAYNTPGDPRYYRNKEVSELYIQALEYCRGRGLDENAWAPDHAGTASRRAIESGLVRQSGDFSSAGLRLGGFCQSIFLMREPLREAGLLDDYRAVLRNLSINCGPMFSAFFELARADAGFSSGGVVPEAERYFLNADGIRLFVDYFIPYYLLVEDPAEKAPLDAILKRVVAKNLIELGGTRDTIKPDGVGFHHAAAYVGGYSPYAFEAMAQLLYLLAGENIYAEENLAAVRGALEAFRVMAQKYAVSTSLKGRLLSGREDSAAVAVVKALALLAHPDGVADTAAQARFKEYFDADYFYQGEALADFYKGKRGVPIRGLGIFGMVADIQALEISAASAPMGCWIKPYAAAAFHRRDDWLVTAKGFSRYFWDYEGPLNKRQNSFGQNWSYGLLQVFNAGNPVGEASSGHDLANGWDWYHLPGTTASHYPIEKRSHKKVKESRKKQGLPQRDIHRNYNDQTYVGGVSLGEHGLFVQALEAVPFTEPTDLTARKTYFMVGDRVLALGTDVSGGTGSHETHTTLFQTKIEGPVSASERVIAPGASEVLLDSAGNAFYLAGASAETVARESEQQSMTPEYKPTSGAYRSAWINHGVKPRADHYAYVVFPNDPQGARAKALAADPDAHFQVRLTEGAHWVDFPRERISAFAFYEPIKTPSAAAVESVDRPSAILWENRGEEARLAVAVPDLGWSYDREALRSGGLSYASKAYADQTAKTFALKVVLRGAWSVLEPSDVSAEIRRENTFLTIACRDGASRRLTLRKR